MNANNFGRIMAYLTLVYMVKESEDMTREAVRLTVEPLKNIDLTEFQVRESLSTIIWLYSTHLLIK